MTPAPKTVEAHFKEAEASIARSREVLAKQGSVELSGLEALVGDLCGAIAELGKQKAKIHEKPLQKLLEDLSALESELLLQREIIASQLTGLHPAKEAAIAYRKSQGLDPHRLRHVAGKEDDE